MAHRFLVRLHFSQAYCANMADTQEDTSGAFEPSAVKAELSKLYSRNASANSSRESLLHQDRVNENLRDFFLIQ